MFADKIKQLRIEKNLLQKDIASMLNITTSAYGFYEQGKREPSNEAVKKLAEFYNVTTDYLLNDDDSLYNNGINIIGKRIRQLRIESGYTLNELAQRINVTPSAIEMYEQNRRVPDIDNLILLTQVFNVTSDYILGIENSSELLMNKSSKYYPDIKEMHSTFIERFIKLYCKNKLDFDTEEQALGLTHDQITAIKATRLPNIIELKQLSKAFKVSINHLLGLPEQSLSEEEQELLEYYNSLSKTDKRLAMGNMVAIMKQSDITEDSKLSKNILYSNVADLLHESNKVAEGTLKYNTDNIQIY